MAFDVATAEDRPMAGCIVFYDGLVEHFENGVRTVSMQKPSRVWPGRSAAAHDESPGIHHQSDSTLEEAIIRSRRDVEDRERHGQDATMERRLLQVHVALKHVRFRLRMRYGARCPWDELGTDVYDHYFRLDEPPSYWLAFQIDRARFDAGQRHIVAWAA